MIETVTYEYIDFVKTNGYFEYRRNEQSKYWMYETINEQLLATLAVPFPEAWLQSSDYDRNCHEVVR